MVEMLISMAALLLIMVVLFQAISSTSSVWTRSVGKVQAFQAARSAFESMTRNLAQATLQGYYGYADSDGLPVPLVNPSFTSANAAVTANLASARLKSPTKYLRQSELHFVCEPASVALAATGLPDTAIPGSAVFFQAPIGYSNASSYSTRPSLLNTCGYFVQFTTDAESDQNNDNKGTGAIPSFTTGLPATPAGAYRYRLMEVAQTSEQNGVYQSTNVVDPASALPLFNYDKTWISAMALNYRVGPSGQTNRHVLADNVLLLIIRPKLAPEDEDRVAADLGRSWNTVTDRGSLIAPKYVYDSRSWEPGYTGLGVTANNAQNRALMEKVIMNRLPPIVEVVMVAVDERSALRLADKYGGAGGMTAPFVDGGLKALVGFGTTFQDATRYDDDLATLEDGLNGLGLNYRLFRTELRLPGAAFGE